MNVYDQIQDLDLGTEVTIALRGTIRDCDGGRIVEFGGGYRFTTSLMHAESITVHEPEIKWQIGDVVRGPYGVTFVRDEDGKWRAPSGKNVPVTDRDAHTYTPVIREGEIVAQPEPDHPKVGDTLAEEQLTEHPGPWSPGQDVTARLAAGEIAPEGTILADRHGNIFRVEAGNKGTMWMKDTRRWSLYPSGWSWTGLGPFTWQNATPLHVATPEQIRAAGIEVQS